MINHVRTLLLNQSHFTSATAAQGEVYVPDAFIPRQLPVALVRVRRVLFGSNPDRLFLNCRLRQYMQLLHTSYLQEDVYLDDPRVTYLPFDDTLFQLPKISIRQTAGDPSFASIYGRFLTNKAVGKAQQKWRITITDEQATVANLLGDLQEETIQDTARIPLPQSSLYVSMQTVSPGQVVEVTATALPRLDAGTVLQQAAAALGEEGSQILFPYNGPAVLTKWAETWHDDLLAVNRFSALLLALAYKTDRCPGVANS